MAVVYGGATGLQLKRSVLLTRDTAGIPGAAEEYGGFGSGVATGDFNGDGSAELAVGSTNGLSGGSVQLIVRTTGGGFGGGAPVGPGAAGLPGDADRFCAFGSVLVSGDVHGDGRDDLAVADPSLRLPRRGDRVRDGRGDAAARLVGRPDHLRESAVDAEQSGRGGHSPVGERVR